MKSLLQGNAYVLNPTNRTSVVELLKTRLGFKTTQEAEGAYEDLTHFYVLRKSFPYRDGLQSITAEVAKVVPKAAGLKLDDVADATRMQTRHTNWFIGSAEQA